MPVTARLSRAFYERLGEDIANELVDWFNAVDATYRSDLREINEINYARFDAKLEQRLAELGAELRGEIAEFRADMRTEMEALRTEFRTALEAQKADLIKWMFLFWAGTALAGLLTR